jgi:hypothetical protein
MCGAILVCAVTGTVDLVNTEEFGHYLQRTLRTGNFNRLVIELSRNTSNLGSCLDVDQVGWGLDEVSVDGLLAGERGAVGLADDARVVSSAALVEPLQ